MLLILIVLAFLYLKFMVVRHAMNRFIGDICFCMSFSATFIALTLLLLCLSTGAGGGLLLFLIPLALSRVLL
jgi:hypothetical protein